MQNRLRFPIIAAAGVVALTSFPLTGDARPASPPSSITLSLPQAVRMAQRSSLAVRASSLSIEAARRGKKLAYGLLGPHLLATFDLQFLGGKSAFNLGGGGAFSTDPSQATDICAGTSDTVGCLLWLQQNGEFLGATLGYAFSSFGDLGGIFLADSFKVSIAAIWPIFNWKNILQIRQAKLGVALSEHAHRNTIQDTVLRVVLTYYGILAAKESVAIIDETSKATQEHLRQAKALLQVGKTTTVDVLRWRTRIAEDEQRRLEADQSVITLKVQLANLLGLPLRTRLFVVTPAAAKNPSPPRPTSRGEPSETHPMLKLADLQVKVKEMDKRKSRAAFFPTLDLTAAYAWQHYMPYEDSTKDIGWLGNWSVGLSLKVPIFDSMTKVYDVQIKDLALRKARMDRDNTRRLIRQQVHKANLDVMLAYRKIAVALKQARLAKAAHDNAKRLYEAGTIKTTDLLEAQNALTLAEFNALRARYGYLTALATRDRALGEVPVGAR